MPVPKDPPMRGIVRPIIFAGLAALTVTLAAAGSVRRFLEQTRPVVAG